MSDAVIEFGEPAPRRLDALTGLVRDRRVGSLAAGLGAVALFASLISEWQVTAIDGTARQGSEVGLLRFESTIGDLGGWGAAYLVGLFLLVTAAVFTLFGPVPGRGHARLAALSVGGVLLAVVLAVYSTLGDHSWAVRKVESIGLEDDQLVISVGRGPWCALAGLVLVLLAAYFAAAFKEPRLPDVPREDELPEAPLELTVTPSKTWDAT